MTPTCNSCDRIVSSEADLDVRGYCSRCVSESGGRHTPGPWKLVDPALRGMARTITADGKGDQPMNWCIAHVSESMTVRGHVLDGEANARLIVAAPDLLHALQEITDELEYQYNAANNPKGVMEKARMKLISQARAAIAKAEGRS